MKINIGDTVEHDGLGTGKVISINHDLFMFKVKFDKCPPLSYNCATNPCWVFGKNLIKILQVKLCTK